MSDLIQQLPATLAATRDGCDRVAVSGHGIKIIADQISAIIADNDRKVAERRDAFEVGLALRRSS